MTIFFTNKCQVCVGFVTFYLLSRPKQVVQQTDKHVKHIFSKCFNVSHDFFSLFKSSLSQEPRHRPWNPSTGRWCFKWRRAFAGSATLKNNYCSGQMWYGLSVTSTNNTRTWVSSTAATPTLTTCVWVCHQFSGLGYNLGLHKFVSENPVTWQKWNPES